MKQRKILFIDDRPKEGNYLDVGVLLMVYALSYLMVSSHHYQSFKQVSKAKTFQVMVFMVLILIVIATEPQVTLFLVGVLYVLSGPLAGVYRLLFKGKKTEEKQKKFV